MRQTQPRRRRRSRACASSCSRIRSSSRTRWRLSAPRIGVITYPGSQDDRDALWALTALGAEAVAVWHEESDLSDLDAVVVPGGFSYGDYLRCGAIARFSPATIAACEYADAGGYVLGICNGFQILCEAGLLPGALLRNQSLRFVSTSQASPPTQGAWRAPS